MCLRINDFWYAKKSEIGDIERDELAISKNILDFELPFQSPTSHSHYGLEFYKN